MASTSALSAILFYPPDPTTLLFDQLGNLMASCTRFHQPRNAGRPGGADDHREFVRTNKFLKITMAQDHTKERTERPVAY